MTATSSSEMCFDQIIDYSCIQRCFRRLKREKKPVTEETPVFRNIDIRNVICHNAGFAMEFNGLPEMPISHISLHDIDITSHHDAVFQYCEDLKKDNVNIKIIK